MAIERNGEIVPKSQHGSTHLASGDTLEIVVAVGGGSEARIGSAIQNGS
ncbi:MAG: sulfur carrier protein ThiS [Betaproteobacteria bacterium]|nr:sulfur carrier protein ThiS [Betaproteobacteria bacterium]